MQRYMAAMCQLAEVNIHLIVLTKQRLLLVQEMQAIQLMLTIVLALTTSSRYR